MAILRKVKKSDFTVIDNNIFKNKDLSYKAKGLLCTMLSLPDDWNFSEDGLSNLSSDGISSVRTTLKELMGFGYLERTRARDDKGILRDTVYTIYEEPTLENPNLDKPILENLKTYKELNNKELNNKKEIYKERFKKPSLEEVSDYCKERNNGINPQTFIDFYESKGWLVGKSPMQDWKACIRTWERNRKQEVKQEIVPTWFEKQNELNKMSAQDEEDLDTILEEMGY